MPITIDQTGQTVTLNPPYSPVLPDDGLQRITQVYFAKKKVTAEGTNFAFDRIDSLHTQQVNGVALPYDSILGKTIYLIIETENMATLSVDARIKPSDTSLTGTTDNLALMQFNTQTQLYVPNSILTATVGNFDALNNRITAENPTGSHVHYTNLADHQNKAIIKLQLRPALVLDFNNWARNILNTPNTIVNLEITVKRTDNEPCAFGANSSEEITASGNFLNSESLGRFRITNKKVFHIYHGNNSYNTYALVGTRRRRIGKIVNSQSSEAIYFYYDQHDNEHRICARQVTTVSQKRRVATVPALAARGTLIETIEYTDNRNAQEQIDAYRIKVYTNGSLGEGISGNKWYANQGTNIVELVNMDVLENAGVGPQIFEAFNYNQNGTQIRYGFVHSRRRAIKPESFAGFLGALAQFRQEGHTHYIVSQGFSYADGSCYPSAEHVNGEAGDINLLPMNGNGNNTKLGNPDFDYDSQVILRNLLYDFGFLNARSERYSNVQNDSDADDQEVLLPNSIHTVTPRHNNHLHVHAFNAIRNIYE